MCNDDECMLGGVMEEKRGTVRAVHLAGGRSPGRVGRASRVLKSIFLTLACASCSADAEDAQQRRVHARWGHGGEAWDGARCPPRCVVVLTTRALLQ